MRFFLFPHKTITTTISSNKYFGPSFTRRSSICRQYRSTLSSPSSIRAFLRDSMRQRARSSGSHSLQMTTMKTICRYYQPLTCNSHKIFDKHSRVPLNLQPFFRGCSATHRQAAAKNQIFLSLLWRDRRKCKKNQDKETIKCERYLTIKRIWRKSWET